MTQLALTAAAAAARPRPEPLPFPRALRPNAAAVLLLGTLAVLLGVGDRLLNDPDTYWHVAVGERIWTGRSVPWTDEWSHTFAGAPWIAKEWLSQVLLFGAHALAGWSGVAVLAALVVASSFALLFARLRERLQPTAALAMTLVAVMLAAPHLLARPHLFTFPVVIVWVSALVDALERRSAPAWWLPLVMALWANLHAGFTIGLVLAGLFGVEAVLVAPRGRKAAAAARWGLFLAASLLAACATPYGHRSMLVTLTLFGSGEPLAYIKEWQPLAFGATGWTALGALAFLAGALLPEARRNLVRLAALALLGTLMIRHARFLDLFALAAPLVAAAPLARRHAGLGSPVPLAESNAASRAVTAALLVALAAAGLAAGPRPNPRMTPDAALQAARAQGLAEGRVYNDYDFGGYLIAQGVKTFIDGRSDQIFLGGFTRAAHEAADGPYAATFARLLDRHGVTWALVRPASNEARHFAALADWERVHADGTAAVYARR